MKKSTESGLLILNIIGWIIAMPFMIIWELMKKQK